MSATAISDGRSELEALIEAAKKATPGPWKHRTALKPVDGEYDCAIVTNLDGRPSVIGECFGRVAEDVRMDATNNAAFIALANPSTVAAMASELLALREAVGTILPYLRWTIGDESPGHHPTMPSAVAVVEAAAKIGGSHV